MIVLTYCGSTIEKNRICGHTFEVMDYYLLFKELGYDVKILIQENINKNIVFEAWEDKYILTNYKNDIIFKHSKIIKGDILIFVDGMKQDYWKEYHLIYKKLILFRCNPKTNYTTLFEKTKNVLLLQDDRVYKIYNNYKYSYHYIKKINFKMFKNINKSLNKTLIYINSNLRKLKNITPDINTIYVSGTNHNYGNDVLQAPVINLFEKFNTFLYTKTTIQFDCSPRFIAECKFYNKNIKYDFNFKEYCGPDYGDTGLYWRNYDLKKLDNLFLTSEDEIINLIKKES
jgi:hypothetical protein